MNAREAFSLGYDRGWNCASWTDMPDIGTTLPKHVDWEGIGLISTVADQISAWELLCGEAESNGRQFSPFEFTAQAINESRDPDGYWERFDAGIESGMRAYRRKHFPVRRLNRNAKEAMEAV